MNYITVEIEAKRSHPELNPKISTYDQILKYYKLDKKSALPKYFISFTDIPKIGINPKSEFHTPAGIYTYPIRYVIKNDKLDVPFAGKRKYIHILELNTNKILNGKTYSDSDYYRDERSLNEILNQSDVPPENYENYLDYDLREEYGDDAWEYVDCDYLTMFSDADADSLAEANHRKRKPIDRIWCLSQVISKILSGDKNNIIKWNSLLRYMGYDMALDEGLGFIHPNEPIQALFLVKNAFRSVDLIENADKNLLSKSEFKLKI